MTTNPASQDDPSDCGHVVEIDDEPRHHLVIANEYIRAFAVEIAPHDRTLCHHHPNDYLLYVASDAEIVSAARDEAPKRLSYRDGECELSKAGLTHVVENVGDTPFRNIVVELLERGKKLRRGEEPKVVSAAAGNVEAVLREDTAAVFQIDMQPECEVEISGAAVVAAPYQPVMMKEVEEFDIPLHNFRKLTWVCAPRKVSVRSVGTQARIIVFQVGHRQD